MLPKPYIKCLKDSFFNFTCMVTGGALTTLIKIWLGHTDFLLTPNHALFFIVCFLAGVPLGAYVMYKYKKHEKETFDRDNRS